MQAAISNGRNGLGCVIVFAAGNNNNSTVSYPANAIADIVAVGALSPCGERKNPSSCDGETNWGSNYGTALDVMAPGVLIPTTDISGSAGYSSGDYFNRFNGTSSACPHVAGIAALVLSVNPSLTQKEVVTIIEKTAKKTGNYSYATVWFDVTVLLLNITISLSAAAQAAKALHKPYPISLFQVPLGLPFVVAYE